MKPLLLTMILLTLVACTKDPLTTEKADNAEFEISLLFNHEGCKMFRFFDAGEPHYFTKCGETMTRRCHYNPAIKRTDCKMETIK